MAGQTDKALPWKQIEGALEYIRNTKEVRDVLLSGGDSLLIGEDNLEKLLRPCVKFPM